MTYYEKKRKKAGLTISETANELGVEYKKYQSIDRGNRKMPSNLIDKFNEIINKGKINDIERINREELVNNWWEQMKIKTESKKYKLNEKMEEFNIKTFKELAELLGYKDASIISVYLNNKQQMSFDAKNRFYSFFENELNIQEPKIEVSKEKEKTVEEQKLLKWYKDFDIKDWANKNNIGYKQLHIGIGVSTGTLSNLLNKRFDNPNLSTLLKLKNYIDLIESNKEEKLEKEIDKKEELFFNPIEERLLSKYSMIIEELNQQIEEKTNKINILEKEVSDIEKRKSIYTEILVDIKR